MAFSNRSSAHSDLKQYAQALADLDKAIELDPMNASAYNNRGLLNSSHGKGWQAALADYDKAVELDPDFAVAYYNRGHVYAELKMNEQAKADYDKALSLTSDTSLVDRIQKSLELLKSQ